MGPLPSLYIFMPGRIINTYVNSKFSAKLNIKTNKVQTGLPSAPSFSKCIMTW